MSYPQMVHTMTEEREIGLSFLGRKDKSLISRMLSGCSFATSSVS